MMPLLPRPLDKIELLSIPCFREVWDVFDGISVDRRRSCGMTKVLVDGAANSNQPMIQLFPEGATTNGDYMLRFHLGAFLSDLPIQPAAIRYTLWGTSKKLSHISFFHNYPRHWIAFLCVPAITVDVTFLETVSMKRQDDENDPRAFADSVSLMIANFLGIRVLNLTSSAIYKADHMGAKTE
jgi:1-acyl-sn-glycerol-3-phosphate acyltransferase